MTPSRPAFARWLGDTNDITRMFLAAGQIPDLVNLAGGLPEADTYPVAELSELARKAVADHPADTLNYPPIEGVPALRAAVAERYSSDNLRLGAENVLITSGGLQALDLIGKVLVDEGQVIAAQTPAYLGALDAWRPRRPTYRPVDFEGNAFDPEAALGDAQFLYTVPNFSNPTGHLVPEDRRRAVVEASLVQGTWVVEDDPYGALYYDGAPLPRLIEMAGQGGAYDGPVVYLGTLSKELAPGLRIGWIIAAPEMIGMLTLAKQGSDMSTSGLSQRVALDALRDGLPERVLPRILDTYRTRRDALCAAMEAHLAPWFTWERPVGGMFVWATGRDPGLDTDRLLNFAMEAGVCVSPSSVFDPEGRDRRSVRINFTLNPPDRLEEGVRRLTVACERCVEGAS